MRATARPVRSTLFVCKIKCLQPGKRFLPARGFVALLRFVYEVFRRVLWGVISNERCGDCPCPRRRGWLENSKDANEQIHTHIMVGLGCRFRRLFFKSTVGSGPDHDSGAKNDRGWIE